MLRQLVLASPRGSARKIRHVAAACRRHRAEIENPLLRRRREYNNNNIALSTLLRLRVMHRGARVL